MPNNFFAPVHYGLFFTLEHIKSSQKQRENGAVKVAWDMLENSPRLNDENNLYWLAMLYRIYGDMDAGVAAIGHLISTNIPTNLEINLFSLRDTLFKAHCFELLRDHPACIEIAPAWLDAFSDQIALFNQMPHGMASLERFWLCAINLAAGVVLEDAVVFNTGVAAFKDLIAHQVHPDGYFKFVADRKDETTYLHHVMATAALALAAEIATNAGVNLWSFNHRGVSIVTAATYILYYYYFPDKWLWYKGLTPDETQQIFRQYGAFIEIVNYHSPLRGVDILLDELRPLFDLQGGGLTTLTHARLQKRRILG